MNKTLYIAIAAALGSANALAAGSIVFDNTLPGQPHGTTTAVPLVNGTYTINASNTGYLSGRNLFESFATFTVASGETASFTNPTNLSISNVISRVTGIGSPNGLQPTTINGNVVSTIQGANFWFINPAGVTIGAGAKINVPAGLAIGAADYIGFADGSRFYALPSNGPQPAVFTTASPAAFGFLPTAARGAVALTGTDISLTGPITLSAGPGGVSLTNSSLTTTNDSGIPGSTSSAQLAISSAGGAVVLQSSNVLTTNIPWQSGQTASAPANIVISGNTIAVHGGSVVSQTHNGTDAGTITLTAMSTSPTAIQVDGGASLASETGSNPTELGTGGSDSGTGAISLQAAAGGIAISAGTIQTFTGTKADIVPDAGQPGPISLSAQQISLAAASLIEVWDNSLLTARQVNAQGVQYTVPVVPAPISLSASGPIAIVGSTLLDTSISQLPVGDIDIAAASLLLNGATLNTERGYYGSQSGDINVTVSGALGPAGAPESLLIEGGSTVDANGASSGSGGGGSNGGFAGDISLSAPAGAIRIANSTVTAENNGGTTSGRGFITVTAASNLTLDTAVIQSTTGEGGNLPPDAITLQSGGPMLINASTISDISPNAGGLVFGTGGNVTISAPSVLINGGSIETTTYAGAGGSVLITASGTTGVGPAQGGTGDAVLIKGGATIGSDASYYNIPATGPAGNITITAPAGSIQVQQSTVSTSTHFGQAGVISLSGASGLTLDGATLLSRTLGGGSASTPSANIALQSSGPITITSGSSIDSSTNGDAPAGRISIATPAALVVSGSSLTSTTGGSPDDGPFGLPGGGSGQAGSITLTGGTIHVTGGTISVSTTGNGPANTVTLGATGPDSAAGAALIVGGGAVIESDASQGQQGANAGTVTLTATNGTVQVGLATDSAPSSLSTSAGMNAGAAGAVTITGAAIDLGDAKILTTTASTQPSTTRGTIVLDAGQGAGPLTLRNSSLDAATSGVQQAGEIDLEGAPILISNSTISSATTGTGSAGAVCVGTPGCVAAGTAVPATGGSIDISDSTLSTSTSTFGNAGDIQVNGSSVNVSGGQLTASTTGTGNAGNVSLTATAASGVNGAAALLVSGGASLTSDASGGASPAANAGFVKLAAPAGTVQVGLATDTSPTSLSSAAGVTAGAPGTVTIAGAGVDLEDAKVSTTAAGSVPSATRGSIVLTAGNGAGPLTVANSTLNATTSGVQQAGEIDLQGAPIIISNSMISSKTTGSGAAGAICVSSTGSAACVAPLAAAGAVDQRRSTIHASSPSTGSIAITGSTLSTSTSTSGNAGDINVTTTGALALSNATIESQSTSPSATTAGSVGVINLTAGSISMANQSLVSATSVGANSGAPGPTTPAITISSTGGTSPLLIADSSVNASAGLANGSNLVINAGGSPIRLQNSTILASATAGNGGNITINDAGTTTLQQTGILAQAGPGNGGAINIQLKAGALFVQDAQSLVSATSQSGNNGTVTISAPQTNFQSSLRIPDVSAAKAPELSANACQRDASHSTFVREGRGGVTPGPDDYLPGRSASAIPAGGESAHQSGDTAPGLVASTAAAGPAGCP